MVQQKGVFKTKSEIWFCCACVTALLSLIAGLGYDLLESYAFTVRQSRANSLKQIVLGMANYHTAYDAFPPLVFRDANGRSTTSWRLSLISMMESGPPTYQDLNVPWNVDPNRQYSNEPYLHFCMTRKPGAPDCRVFAVNCDDPIFGRSESKDIPVDAVIAAWTEAVPGLNWAAPGDICLDKGRGECHISPGDIPEDVTALFVFYDCQVWECRGREAFLRLAEFASVRHANAFDRESLVGKSCTRVLPTRKSWWER